MPIHNGRQESAMPRAMPHSVFSVRMGCLRTCPWRAHLTSVFCVHVYDGPPCTSTVGTMGSRSLPLISPCLLCWSLTSLVFPMWLSPTVPMFHPKCSLSSFKIRDAFQTSVELVLVPPQESQKLKVQSELFVTPQIISYR